MENKTTKSKKQSTPDRDAIWEKSVTRAKEILGKTKLNQMEVAELALGACEISWGGSQHRSKYTLTEFAEQIGMSPKALSHWVAVRVSVFDKIPKDLQAKAQFTPLSRVAAKVSRDFTPEKVEEVYREYINSSGMDKSLRHYLSSIRSAHYSFVFRKAAETVDEKILEEYLFYCTKIVYMIKKGRPGIQASNNKIASENGKVVVSAAAAILGRQHRERGRDVMVDDSGAKVRVTPKDRDVINFLRNNPGKWFGPTEIGVNLRDFKRDSASAWAYRTLNKFSGTGLVDRNNKGHYRWIGPNEENKGD